VIEAGVNVIDTNCEPIIRWYPSINQEFLEGLSAVCVQHSAKDLFFLLLVDSLWLMAGCAHGKTAVFGWKLDETEGFPTKMVLNSCSSLI
jgi:hypothetical protein